MAMQREVYAQWPSRVYEHGPPDTGPRAAPDLMQPRPEDVVVPDVQLDTDDEDEVTTHISFQVFSPYYTPRNPSMSPWSSRSTRVRHWLSSGTPPDSHNLSGSRMRSLPGHNYGRSMAA